MELKNMWPFKYYDDKPTGKNGQYIICSCDLKSCKSVII